MRFYTTWIIFLCALALITTSVVMVYSSSAAIAARQTTRKALEDKENTDPSSIAEISTHSTYFLERQAIFVVLGIAAMLFFYQVDYERYRKYATAALMVTFILLLMVYLPAPISVRINGAKRWLNLGFTNLQVSELAKLTMIVYMAKKLTDRQAELQSFIKGFFPLLFILGLFCGAIVFEPDLGAAVMLGIIVYTMWFVGGMRMIHLMSVVAIAVPAIVVLILSQPFRIRRMVAFMNPMADRSAGGWQLSQSLISVATGGVEGRGLGAGPQKYLFLSEGHTDFIYANICEELGMIGGLSLFAIYMLFFFQGIRVAVKAPDMYGSLMATGITAMIGIQAFVNMYVVTGLLPTKGLTLPLVSYGGSSLVINCMAIGILMNISRYTEMAAAPARKSLPATVHA